MLAGALAVSHNASDFPPTGSGSPARQLEVGRLRAHFDSVDAELRDRAVRLTTRQQTARVTLIGWLREYRDAGEFPRNNRLPVAMPIFRDGQGALCAMAYLIERSGRGDLVDRVALTRNNAFIAELADDPDLRAWLDSVGLSVTEAARVQPQYEPFPEEEEVTASYAVTSILVSGASLTSLGLNLISPSKSSGWAGLLAGSLGIIAGAANLDGAGGTEKVAAANMIIGGGAMVAGLYLLLNPPPTRLLSEPAPQTAGSSARLAIAPLVVPSSAGPRFGLAMHRSF
jgi:hypothetical protein